MTAINTYMKINKLLHIYLFTFGFFYYLILPLIVLIWNLFDGYPGMNYLYMYYDNSFLYNYIFISIGILFSFIFGSLIPLFYIKKKKRKENKVIYNKVVAFFLVMLFIFANVVIYYNRGLLFSGYKDDVDILFTGQISSINTVFLFFLLYYIDVKERFYTLFVFILLSIVEFSIVLLGLGSRMYVFIPCIVLLVYYYDKGKLLLKHVFIILVFLIVFLLTVAIWRLGDMVVSFDKLLFVGCTEPVYTWITAVSMFSENKFSYFSFPDNFITSFLNFIPSVLLPNKSDLIFSVDMKFDAPFGGMSLLVSLVYNFGVLGSFLALFFLGLFFTYVRYNFSTYFGNVYYYCICSVILFQLFRDNFSIVNKMIFYNFLIIPMVILLLSNLIKWVIVRYCNNSYE